VDSLDGGFEVRSGENIAGVVITFTDHPSEVSGLLQAATGAPASDYFLIVFAADKALWTSKSRRIAMARPGTTGEYSVRNLPPGDYFVAAVTDATENQWFDPAFLDTLIATATRITLAEGEKKTHNLRIGN
jgi:hypothetical protein